MLKAILFDLDDTLRDFMHTKRKSCDAAIRAMIRAGLKIERKKAEKILFGLYAVHGIEDKEIFQKFLREVSGKVDDRILAEGIVAYREAQMPNVKPYRNVKSTLAELRKRGLKLGIISDAPRIKVWMRLAEIKLSDAFDAVVGFEDTFERKPSSAPFEFALRRLGVKPQECLYVGDWPERDVAGGKAIGMKTALAVYSEIVPYGQKHSNFAEAKRKFAPDYVLRDIRDILKIAKENPAKNLGETRLRKP